MDEIMHWCAFVGAWLLVIGPLHQAVIDIGDEDFDRERFTEVFAELPRPPAISPWWLLLPPVAYWLKLRRDRMFRSTVVERLTHEQLEQVLHFRETTSAWLFVSAGAFLIAIGETWGLRTEHHWPTAVFWILLVAMVVVCIASTSARVIRRRHLLGMAQ